MEASAKDDQNAAEVPVDTANFDGALSSSDSTVQAALETINDLDFAELAGDDNVQADWDETDDTDDSYIQNKPTIPTIPDNATEDAAGLMSADDKTKLNGVAAGAEVNVQADWEEDSASSDSFIQNKPTIPTIPGNATDDTAGLMSGADKTKLDNIEPNAKNDQSAAEVTVDASMFDGHLSPTDTTVQAALETLDDAETIGEDNVQSDWNESCLLYTSPSPRDRTRSRMPSSA